MADTPLPQDTWDKYHVKTRAIARELWVLDHTPPLDFEPHNPEGLKCVIEHYIATLLARQWQTIEQAHDKLKRQHHGINSPFSYNDCDRLAFYVRCKKGNTRAMVLDTVPAFESPWLVIQHGPEDNQWRKLDVRYLGVELGDGYHSTGKEIEWYRKRDWEAPQGWVDDAKYFLSFNFVGIPYLLGRLEPVIDFIRETCWLNEALDEETT